MIHITIPRENIIIWFDNVEVDEDEKDDFSFEFGKCDEDTLLITECNPDFWTE